MGPPSSRATSGEGAATCRRRPRGVRAAATGEGTALAATGAPRPAPPPLHDVRWWVPAGAALRRDGRWPLLALTAADLLRGLLPAAGVAATARLLDAVAPPGPDSAARALAAAGVLIGLALLNEGIPVAARIPAALLHLRLQRALDGRTLESSARAAYALFERSDFHDLRAQVGTETGLRTAQWLDRAREMVVEAVRLVSLGWLLGGAAWWLPLAVALPLLAAQWAEMRIFDAQRLLRLQQAAPARVLSHLGALLGERPAAAETRLFRLADHLTGRWGALFRRLAGERSALRARMQLRGLPLMVWRRLVLGAALIALVRLGELERLAGGRVLALAGALALFAGAVDALTTNLRLLRSEGLRLADGERFHALVEAAATGAPDPVLPRADGSPGGVAPPDPPPSPAAAEARAAETASAPPGPAPKDTGRRSQPTPPAITMEGVHFRYPGAGTAVLHGLDLSVAGGEHVALVGVNGAGKSTAVKLLLGLYRPDAGRIRLGPARGYHRAVSAVLQDFERFQFTAGEFVAMGDLSRRHDRAGIAAALEAAGLPDLADEIAAARETPLGRAFHEDGREPSGGQWQRLALARALFADPGLLILDEPASALDPRAEADLYRRFREVAGGRTVITVSHRLGAARAADRILVLAGGRVAEEGSHDALVARGGLYAAMFAAQAHWYGGGGAGAP